MVLYTKKKVTISLLLLFFISFSEHLRTKLKTIPLTEISNKPNSLSAVVFTFCDVYKGYKGLFKYLPDIKLSQ